MNWGQLKDAVATYLHRNDGGPLMDSWLAMAEARIYYGEQSAPALRISAMSKCAILTGYERPDDFLEARVITGTGTNNKQISIDSSSALGDGGYSWNGNCIQLPEGADLPVTMEYYGKFAPLVADTDTNALLTMHPNIYLSAMLVDAARWSRDNELGAREAANYSSAVSALHSSDNAAKYSGSRLVIKPMKGINRGR